MVKRVLLNIVLVIAILVGVLAGPVSAASTAQPAVAPVPEVPEPPEAAKEAPTAPDKPQTAVSGEQALAKLDPDLREMAQPPLPSDVSAAQVGTGEPIIVTIIAQGGVSEGSALLDDLRAYFVDGKLYAQQSLTKPVGSNGASPQLLAGLIRPHNLLKVASDARVTTIVPATPERQEYEPYPADDAAAPAPQPGPEDWASLRENAASLRAGSLPWSEAKALNDGAGDLSTQDWFEVTTSGPHKADAAWERGYKGEGVAVAVIDDGVDMAHPDLMGTQKIYSSTVASEYNGWPMVMDPFTMRAYFYDLMFGTTYVAGSFPGTTYIDTSATPDVTPAGVDVSTFKYTPMIDYGVPGLQHTYVISNAMTKSGVIHAGTHTDESLRDYIWGEKVAVLVGDPNVAGVYDTVWIDLDDDYDFRDEKPLTRANVNDPSTYNAMIAYRDMNGDGKADLSGGMLYWIADGTHWVPGMDWLFVPTLGFGLTPPASGELIAIHGPWISGYSHGTQCASNVVAQGVIDGMLPEFSDLPGGTPAAAVYGAAPNADLVPMNNAYSFSGNVSYNDAYMLAAIGWDGVDQTGWHMLYGPGYVDTDAIQITSNSYGFSADDNDGWDPLGQYVWQIQRYYAPSLQFLFSTGNGAPGYGTTAPPSPGMGIAVGASTEYGSTGWDTITTTNQINFNDYTAFSNGGPSARAGSGVDVLASGSYSAGAEKLNYYAASMWGVLDGNISWSTWGGTSRSAPTAMGNLALIYQAYKAKHGVWPTAEQARALLMSSATDINNGVLKQGAGSVNADQGTAVAAGLYGVYMAGDSASWEPGNYRGTLYPGFAQVVYPEDVLTKTFTIHNDSPYTYTVAISDKALALVDSVELDFTVTPTMTQQESVYGAANRDNFYKAFQYMIPITATAGMDSSMHNVDIPAGTDLMVVRQIFPYDEFDVGENYTYDNRFYLMVYNWKDVDGDGKVWDDMNSNGVVNFINGTEWTSVDVGPELAWSDPRTELDRWEYERYGYNRPTANTNELTVQDPLNRMHDGMFIGLRHLYTGTGAAVTVHLKYRIEFYSKADVAWLSTPASLFVPANGTAALDATITVPNDMPAGDYEAAIEIDTPTVLDYPAHTTVIPVTMNVAAKFEGDAITLGGADAYAYSADKPYNTAAVRGYQDWGWREESGDWRMFYVDVESPADAGAHVIVKNEWSGAAPHNDNDTVILGPTATELTTISYGAWSGDLSEPSFFGPYILDTVAKSSVDRSGRATWRFNTTSGANEDWLMFPTSNSEDPGGGLHRVMQHNVLFEGDQFDVVFTTTLGALTEDRHRFDIDTYVDQGLVGSVTLTPTLDLNGLVGSGYLIDSATETWNDEPLAFTGAGSIEWTSVFAVEDAISIEMWTASANVADLDLYLYLWNGSAWVQVGSSAGADASEYILYNNPVDGDYLVAIDNYSGPVGAFDLAVSVRSRVPGITVTGQPSSTVPAGTGTTLTIHYDYSMEPGKTYEGMVLVGPPEAPGLKQIPFTIERIGASAAISKDVDWDVTFPGAELKYTVNLYNLSDPAAVFEFSDPIPADTEFVAVTNATYDAGTNRVVYTGTLPVNADLTSLQGFENGAVPPDGWTRVQTNTAETWHITSATAHGGTYSAQCFYDDNLHPQDEWLISPRLLELGGGEPVSLWSMGSLTWGVTPNDNYDINVWLVAGDLGGSDDVLLGTCDDDWITTWVWAQSTFTLPTTLPAGDLRVGIQYVGTDGAQANIDDIVLPGTPDVLSAPSRVVEITVRVTDTVERGAWITNTAMLTATHALHEMQVEAPVVAQAGSQVSLGPSFVTSTKMAPHWVEPDEEIVYEIRVRNTGTELAFVTLTDPIPVGTTYAWHDYAPPSQNFVYSWGLDAMVWSGNIAPGDEWVFTYAVEPDDDLPERTVVVNTATITWGSDMLDLTATTLVSTYPYAIYMPLISTASLEQ